MIKISKKKVNFILILINDRSATMKKLFYFGILGLVLFEIANVYFIMPMPGSQQMNSISLAYFLYSWRWIFRALFGLMIIAGFIRAFKGSKILSILFLLITGFVVYATNFVMAADSMFLQPKKLLMSDATANKVDTNRIVLGITFNGQAKAYPIQYLGYHHKVFDTIAGKPVMVTYCTVCRTGRVFEPVVNGKKEVFRLVGMDHFNAMFEDETTKSWWRQATGEAIAGKLKGQFLPLVENSQVTLGKWLSLYPKSLVMQPGEDYKAEYDAMTNYEAGKSKGNLTRMDSLSWKDKSWVVGILTANESKAYDWNQLQKERIIYDVLDGQPIVIILSDDNKSFVALERTNNDQRFELINDTLKDGEHKYAFTGSSLDPAIPGLQKLNAYQEYWHSWRTFHPTKLLRSADHPVHHI